MNLPISFSDIKLSPDQVNIPTTTVTSGSVQIILQIVFGLAGAVALVVVVLSGLRFVLAAGDPQKTAQARNTIIYALIGLAICILSFTIVTFVIKKLV